MAKDTIWIAQIVASKQGEGIFAGLPVVIVRTMVCNLACQKAEGGFDCDTAYTWKAGEMIEGSHLTADEAYSKIMAYNIPAVMLTGGEPLLNQHKEAFRELLKKLYESGVRVHVETNGTQKLDEDIAKYLFFVAISPKQTQYKTFYKPSIAKSYQKVIHAYKFVIRTVENLKDASEWLKDNEIPWGTFVELMPEGITAKDLLKHKAIIDSRGKHMFDGYYMVETSRMQIEEGFA